MTNQTHTPTPWQVRGQVCFAGFGVNDSKGRSVFSIPSNGTRPAEERTANAEFCVMACNNHDALVAALRQLVERVDGPEGVRADGSNMDTTAAHAALGDFEAAKVSQ